MSGLALGTGLSFTTGLYGGNAGLYSGAAGLIAGAGTTHTNVNVNVTGVRALGLEGTVTVSTLTTPVLTWTSDDTALDPTFNMTELTVGDFVRFSVTVDAVTTVYTRADAVSLEEALSGTLTYTGFPTLTVGKTYDVKGAYERNGVWSGWSNTETKTMVAAEFPIDFTTGALPAPVTLTRASSGTYLNISDVLATAAVDAARLNYTAAHASRGILIEAAATNVITYSEQFDNAAWTADGVVVLANQANGPDGNMTADLLTATGTGEHRVYQAKSDSTLGTNSVFAKAGTASFIAVGTGGTSESYAVFDVVNGLVSSSGGSGTGVIEDFGGGWFRCSVKAGGLQTTFCVVNIGTTAAQALPGASSTIVTTMYLWGAQCELGSNIPATSYIVTTSAAANRAADAATFTIPGGITTLTYTFDDNSTQNKTVSAGAYTIPTNLNLPNIKTIAAS